MKSVAPGFEDAPIFSLTTALLTQCEFDQIGRYSAHCREPGQFRFYGQPRVDDLQYFLIFWGTFFIIVISTIDGVSRVPITRVRAAQCLGSSRLQIFTQVIIPTILPAIITGMRLAMASSFMSIIPAEMLAADSGLGYLLQASAALAQTDRIFVALVTISLLGVIVDSFFRFITRHLFARYTVHLAAA